MLVDGKQIAEEIVAGLGDSLRGRTLGLVVNAGDPATESFVKIKERVAARLGIEIVREDSLTNLILSCDGVVVQLPHPDAEALLAQIPPQKDVDALGPNPQVLAPVAGAVKEVLARASASLKNKKTVVVGEGRLVGKPVAAMLRDMGADVLVVSLEQGSLEQLKDADIVVSGAGSPHLIKPDMLKPGVVLIDAGTSESQGKIVGDCDPTCAEVASVFTPVPGGIGPVAVAMLFRNLFALTK
jgi:methylenetetrahydrofolate dehydrogenase (NADP+)/methenyltetrahydrofolate cyclohydrolase